MLRLTGRATRAALLTTAAVAAAGCAGDGPAGPAAATTLTGGSAVAALNTEGNAVVSNGTLRLGVDKTGFLTVKGQFSPTDRTRDSVGVFYVPAGSEGVALVNSGNSFDGWGVSARTSPSAVSVGITASNSPVTVTQVSFTATDSTAVSVTQIPILGSSTAPLVRITHDFHPVAATRNLYEAAVTFENVSGQAVTDLRYTREVVWHINQASAAYATVQGSTLDANVLRTTDGSAALSPISPDRGPLVPGAVGDFTDVLGNNHGAHIDLGLGELAAGASKTIYLYYGAAGGEAAATAAASAVGARTFGLGQSAPSGAPVTFVMGYKGRTNAQPQAVINGPSTAALNQTLAFSATGSSDPDGDALTYAWDFGDGSTATGAEATHAYTRQLSSYTVTLTASDPFGATGTATRVVTIAAANQPPIAHANGPYAALPGAEVSFSSNGSSDPEGGAISYSWELGDGTTSTEANPKHAYAQAGTYSAKLTVTDPQGLTGTDVAQVVVTANQAPEVQLLVGPKTVRVGEQVDYIVSAGDPNGDRITCTLEFGDAASEGPYECGGDQGPAHHKYAAAGLYTVRFSARDAQGATGAATDTVRVLPEEAANTPPEVYDLIVADGRGRQYAGPVSVGTKSCSGSTAAQQYTTCVKFGFRDLDGAIDSAWSAQVNWGDGTSWTPNAIAVQNSSVLAPHNYAQPGTYTVRVKVTDRRGLSDEKSIAITVAP